LPCLSLVELFLSQHLSGSLWLVAVPELHWCSRWCCNTKERASAYRLTLIYASKEVLLRTPKKRSGS
jgi:hypothetical protein